MSIHVFYGVPKSYPEADLVQEKERLQALLGGTGAAVEVVTSNEAWQAFGQGNGFPIYIETVANGKDYAATPPTERFSLIIVPIFDPADPRCGKATAQIVEKALQVRKKVLAWDREANRLHPVTAVSIDLSDWQAGGHLTVART